MRWIVAILLLAGVVWGSMPGPETAGGSLGWVFLAALVGWLLFSGRRGW